MKCFLVGVLKKNQMKHLFGKHSESLCDYNSITLDKIPGTTYVALFRLENDHFECHTLDEIESWFSKGKTTLPNTRANVTDADINRIFRFHQIMNPPPPPPSYPPPPSPPPPPRSPRSPRRDSSDRFRFVTTRRGRQHSSPDRFRFVTTRRGSRR